MMKNVLGKRASGRGNKMPEMISNNNWYEKGSSAWKRRYKFLVISPTGCVQKNALHIVQRTPDIVQRIHFFSSSISDTSI